MVWHLELQVKVRVPPADGQAKLRQGAGLPEHTAPEAGGPNAGLPSIPHLGAVQGRMGKGMNTDSETPQHLRPEPSEPVPTRRLGVRSTLQAVTRLPTVLGRQSSVGDFGFETAKTVRVKSSPEKGGQHEWCLRGSLRGTWQGYLNGSNGLRQLREGEGGGPQNTPAGQPLWRAS